MKDKEELKEDFNILYTDTGTNLSKIANEISNVFPKIMSQKFYIEDNNCAVYEPSHP